jgi:hypothetical protein
LSTVNYIFNDYSRASLLLHPDLAIQGIGYILVHQVFFYSLGHNIASSSRLERDVIFKKILVLFGSVYLFGIYLHFWRPEYFSIFLESRFLGEGGTEYGSFYPRMTIYWNSMIVGVLGLAFFWMTIYAKDIGWLIKLFLLCIFVSSIIFSAQRGPIMALIISYVFYFFLNLKTRLIFITGITLMLSAGLLSLLYLFSAELISTLDLFRRVTTLEGMFLERADQFENFVVVFKTYPLGRGLGMLSHKAANLGLLYSTPDGNYYRIFGDLGIMGVVSFCTLIFFTVYKAFKRKLHMELLVLSVYLLQAFGTNVFDLYAAGFLFWYFIGFVNGNKMYE